MRITFTATAAAGLAVFGSLAQVRAGDFYWAPTGTNANWTNPDNWFGGNAPGTGDNPIFRGAFRADSRINQIIAYGQLQFVPTAGDVSTNYTVTGYSYVAGNVFATIDSYFTGVSNATNRTQTLNATIGNSSRSLVIDNSTARSDAGALLINGISLVPVSVVGGVSSDVSATLRPGANGIVIAGIFADVSTGRGGGRASVTIDGPGYVAVQNASEQVDYQVTRGTLSLKLGEGGSSLSTTTPAAINLNAGTTLDLDGNLDSYYHRFMVNAVGGRAALNVDAGLNVYSSISVLTGQFAKTGGGEFVQNYPATDGLDVAVQNGQYTAFVPANPARFGAIDVSKGATFKVYQSAVTTPAVTGTGTVEISGNPATLNLAPTTATQLQATLTGTGALAVNAAGGGSVEVQSLNSYSGGTSVNGGKLIVTSAVGGLGGGAVTVNNSGTLTGSGRVSGAVSVNRGGTLAPGSAATPGANTGTFTVGGLDLTGGGTVAIEFNGITAGTTVDQLAVNNGGAFGDATITNGLLSLSRLSGFHPAAGKFAKVSVLKTAGTLTGVFAGVSGVRVNDDYSFAVTYDAKNVYAQLADVSDTNLDNVQDYRDLYALAPNYAKGTTSQIWTGGDLSGDGTVNYTDLLLANSYVPLLTDAQFATLKTLNYQEWYDYGRLNNYAVPEPTSLAAIAIAGGFLARRRRQTFFA